MEEVDYKDNEKVLYKTRGKLSLYGKEVDCLVTENHVVIEAEEPIKIPLSHIKRCRVTTDYLTAASYYKSADITELTYLNDQNQKHKLSLQLDVGEPFCFQRAIYRQLIGKFIDKVVEPPEKPSLKKFFRDKTRDYMCAQLQRQGIDAKMVASGRVEEEIHDFLNDPGMAPPKSLGIIHITEGPISWVNISKETVSSGQGGTSTIYYTEYGIPDPRLEPKPLTPHIHSVRKKTIPVVGRVVDVLWEGADYGTGVISRLNSDHQLKEPIMKSCDVKIKAIGDYGCWIISAQGTGVPSEELWNCYQVIARHLLTEWTATG